MRRTVYDVKTPGPRGFEHTTRFFKLSEAKRHIERHPGSYLDKHDVRKMRGTVVSPAKSKNPRKGWTLIYSHITRIEATKGPKSAFPGQRFFHNFKKPYPAMYGSPDGKSILIKMR